MNLWEEYIISKDPEVKKSLIMQYSNLVYYVIHNSTFPRVDILDQRDLYSFGVLGLSEAIERFDPNYGTKFETYALQRIKGKIIDELRKVQPKPRDYEERFGELKILSISNHVKDDENSEELVEVIEDKNIKNPYQQLIERMDIEQLVDDIQKLTPRERYVLTMYYYEDMDYMAIGNLLGITVSRVSQMMDLIMMKLKIQRINREYNSDGK